MLCAVLTVLSVPLRMEPQGAYCESCAETTPVLWHGRLLLAEHHSEFRLRWQHFNSVGNNSVLIDRVPGTKGFAFVSAAVVPSASGIDTLWLFGTNDEALDTCKPRTCVQTFWSATPSRVDSWKSATLLHLPQNGTSPRPPAPKWAVPWWTAFNTAPTRGVLRGVDVWVLAIELGSPEEPEPYDGKPFSIGTRFTTVFAVCERCAATGDLETGWHVLDPSEHIYRRDRYSACPTIRFFDGWYYVVTLYENVRSPRGDRCGSSSSRWKWCLAEHIVRSRDLAVWEESPVGGNDTLIMGYPDGDDLHGPDHRILPGSYLAQNGSAAQKAYVANQTDDVNRSDMDMVTLPAGYAGNEHPITYVVWLAGNQGEQTPPNLPMAPNVAGIVNGTEQEWLESFF
jgi:hypothetical protein